jgi:pimeloyl-ACP methyl ester carboxylesterase
MTSYVLVHGGAHAGWCWERLTPFLRADPRVGAVVAIDLSGHGERLDVRPLDQITRADYVEDVVREIETRNLRDVVLVGHSLAGITLAEAAARVAGRLRRLIFLSTTNPLPGRSIADSMKHPLSPQSRGIDYQRMFCNDLDADTAAWLLSRLGPEPPGPISEPVRVATSPPGVPSTYVLLERDEALLPAFQREQAEAAAVDEVVPFDAGHSAFASRPRELAELLLRYA